MKKEILVILAFIFSISTNIFAQMEHKKYENDWTKVEAFEKQGAPKSALNTVESIIEQAVGDKNTQQIIKALIYKAKFKDQIDRTDYIELISNLETLCEQSNSIEDKSLLHSMIAELYINYYLNNKYSIDQRSAMVDYIPENIKEWSANIFINKIIENLNLSVKDTTSLKKSTSKDYEDIILLGEDRLFYPTLYDFLMYRATTCLKKISNNKKIIDSKGKNIDVDRLTLPADQYIQLDIADNQQNILYIYYQNYLKELLANGQIATIIVTEIDKAQSFSYGYDVNKDQLKEIYKRLIDKYQYDDACVEIIYSTIVREYSFNNDESKDDAYQMCIDGLKKYPNYYRINILKDWLNNAEIPSISAQGEQIYDPSQNIEIKFTHKNIDTKANKSALRLYEIENGKFHFIKQYDIDIKSAKTYRTDQSNINLGKIGIGNYCLMYNENININKGIEDESSIMQFTVSSLFSFWRNSAKDEYEIYVVDRLSGKPIQNAIIKIYPNYVDADKVKHTPTILKTDNLGLTIYKNTLGKKVYNHSIADYSVSYNGEKELIKDGISKGNYDYSSGNIPSEEEDKTRVSTFTDRSIYRPGQTVYFKAIIVNKDNKVIPNKELDIELRNPNSEIVSNIKLTSNDFGSISDEFVLPLNGLLGQYNIKIGDSYYYFKVEEYKRPTFEIIFDTIDDTYSFGKPLTLKGNVKSYSGVNLQDIDVEYTIDRSPFYFWGMRGNQVFFESGSIKTDKEGKFEIIFVPEPIEKGNNTWLRNTCNFSIKATAKDLNGEVQSNSRSIIVSDVSMFINLSIPQKIEKSENINCQITASNLNGKNIDTFGDYIIYSLNENDSIQDQVLTGNFVTGEQTQLIQSLKNLSSGKYQIEIIAYDNQNKEVKAKQNIILYSLDDDRPPYKTDKWVLIKNDTFSIEKPAEIIFGSSADNLYLLYTLYDQSKVYKREFYNINNKNLLFVIDNDPKYSNSMIASFTFIKEGKFVTENISINRETPKEDIALNLKLEVFRDKLYPGDEETWTISVNDKNNNPVSAELLASMYDSSLDQLFSQYSQGWYLNRFYPNIIYPYPIYFSSRNQYPNTYSNIKLKQAPEIMAIRNLNFDAINWFKALRYYNYGMFGPDEVSMNYKPVYTTAAPTVRSQSKAAGSASSNLGREEVLVGNLMEEATSTSSIDDDNQNTTIRTNFNETAFFYPFLRTNEKGETLISFKAPDSNTTWKFKALAHDKNSKYGFIEKLVITQKELMITPNLPRFARQGDQTSISTKISNLSDQHIIEGTVKIEFFDPSTNQILDIKVDNQAQLFSIEKGASSSASWILNVPKDIEMIGCRIIAGNDQFSDGEQHLLSVLPNRMLVTESMPIDIMQLGKTEHTFDQFVNNTSKTKSDYRLTFEFTNNPAWYAVQALPTYNNPTNENSINWFASYYVNSLGSSIVKQYPQIAKIIQEWKNQNDKTAISNLEKNQELKTILLEETPWVLDAKNETEQMQALSQLLDINNISNKTKVATDKLIELQNQDGGWAWYKDMRSNRSITQYILYGYAKLQNIGSIEYPESIKSMQIKALRYIDDQIKNDFESLKSKKDWEKLDRITTNQLEYLYVRSFYRDIPIDHEAREAERFYTNVASNNWTQLDLYERSLLAVLQKKNGVKELANTITNSIREHAVIDDKQGMYWPNNRSNVFMSLSAISTHVFLMEAMQTNGASTKELDQMKRWLIKQKQVKDWGTTHASIDAISTLLSNGNDWFTSDNIDPLVIQLGNESIKAQNTDLGVGYIKESWMQPDIKKEMGKVEIQNNANKPSYGALYWQYYEDLDKVQSSSKGSLQIKKQIFKESVNDQGKSLTLVSKSNSLQIGDKVIVRLVIETDQDMDFVQIKDMRASCFEPTQTISGIKWQDKLMYYQTTRDASTNFYLDHLPKGTYVLEYPLYVTRNGIYSDGITTIQCSYAPEFVSHTNSIQLIVK